jgi:UDP-N-acetylmuramyl pentapeptide synthase
MNPAITSMCAAIAEARSIAGAKAAALVSATSDRDQILGRVRALESERSTIASARTAGTSKPEDGARLALLALDLEALRALIPAADAAVETARAANHPAAQAVVAAEVALEREVDRETLRRLVEHAAAVDGALVKTVTAIAELSRKFGLGRPCWVPSPELAIALHRLDLNRVNIGPLP